MKLIAHQGDTLDSLLYRYYGEQGKQWVELALELNPHLANQGILAMGQGVEMPDSSPQPPAIKATVQLWD